jgi:LPXTG-motif cell wall-anchored protein
VKISGVDVDNDNANRPHVPCDFDVRFYNFDTSQIATITFTLHPQGVVLRSEIRVVSNDPAGDGLDEDAVFHYSGTTFALDRFPRQPQGYHVRLDVAAENVPGGQKHKMFWLDCPAKAASPTPTRTGQPKPTPARTGTEQSRSAPNGTGTPTSRKTETTSPAPTGAGTTPAPPTASPTELPVTGTSQVGAVALAGLGLTLIGTGTTLMLVRRRRVFVA